MLDTRERLARHLYSSALDLDPEAAIALRVGHADGLLWHCEDGYLNLTVGGVALSPIALNGNLQQLANQLSALGVDVKYANQELMGLASGALLEGSGNDDSSEHDQLKVFQSNLWALLDAYSVEIDAADRQIVEGIAQLYIGTASDEILDYWCEFFGVVRNQGESDPDYRARTIAEVLRPKSNKIAIENSISEIVGDRVELYEPWRDLFYLSESKLDKERTFDGQSWSPYLFRPIYTGNNNIDWSKVVPVIEKLRPAGVLMLDPEWVPTPRGVEIKAGNGVGLSRGATSIRWLRFTDRMILLDDYKLSEPFTPNYSVMNSTRQMMNLVINPMVRNRGWIGLWDGDSWLAHTLAGAPAGVTHVRASGYDVRNETKKGLVRSDQIQKMAESLLIAGSGVVTTELIGIDAASTAVNRGWSPMSWNEETWAAKHNLIRFNVTTETI